MTCVISHKYKFIFIHVPRTGGTAFMSRFSPYWKSIGMTDITTRWHEPISFFEKFKEFPYYFKIAFVRNPWDRVISMWFVRSKNSTLRSFLSNLKNRLPSDKFVRPQTYWIENGSKLNHLARFENYDQEISFIQRKLSLPKLKLDIVRSTPGRSKTYKNYFDKKSIKIVNDIYKSDILNFGYTYD